MDPRKEPWGTPDVTGTVLDFSVAFDCSSSVYCFSITSRTTV